MFCLDLTERTIHYVCVCAYVHLDVYMYNWDGKIYFYKFVCVGICISVILYCLP